MRDSDLRLRHLNTYYDEKDLDVRLYSFIIPLKFILGFCDDYQKIIMNAKHELILVRSRSDVCQFVSAADSFIVKVKRIQWKIPHITLADHSKLMMLRYLEKARSIVVPFRSWDLYEMPLLSEATKNIWAVKSTSQVTKPRFVFVVLQTNRQRLAARSSKYDHCDVTDIKLYLNSECYPYESFNSDFENSNVMDLYHAFSQIQGSYYNGKGGFNPVKYEMNEYQQSPIFAFDCSRTEDSMIGGSVDVRLEINSRINIPANTAAYCVIIYENQFEYSPFKSIVVKSI